MATREAYLEELVALLPQGAAWPREGDRALIGVLDALAAEFERVDQRAEALMVEADPRSADEMLADWERAFGLPDGCVVAEPTVEGRRLALHQRVAALGGQSTPYYVGLSALLGYDAAVETFRPSRLGFTLPRPLAALPWAFAWRVEVHGAIDPEALSPIYASTDLECVVRRIRPAHTVVSFDWSPDPEPTLHFDFLNPPD